MATLEIGRVCLKIAGRESGKYAVVLKKMKDNFVLITGPKILTRVKRRRCNVDHLEPTPYLLKIKEEASDAEVIKAYEEAGLLKKLGLKKPSPGELKEAGVEVKEEKVKPKEEKKKVEKKEKPKKEVKVEKKEKVKKEEKKKKGITIKLKVPSLRKGKPKEKKVKEKKVKKKKLAKKVTKKKAKKKK